MKKRILSLFCSVISVVLIAGSIDACSSVETETTPDTKDCDALADSAREKLQAVLAAHQACSVDADCVSIGFAAGCFNSCSRVINAAGVSALDAATDAVNAAECKTFTADGCKFFPPPCIPPEPVSCEAGRCVGG